MSETGRSADMMVITAINVKKHTCNSKMNSDKLNSKNPKVKARTLCISSDIYIWLSFNV